VGLWSFGDTKSFSIPLLPLDNSSISNNNWFTGFIEADGGFQISIRFKKDGTLYKLDTDMTFNIQQEYPRFSDLNGSYLPIMENIAEFCFFWS